MLSNRRRGNGLAEVLVAFAIIALLVGMVAAIIVFQPPKEVDLIVHDKDYSETGSWIFKERGHWAQATAYYDDGKTKQIELWWPGKDVPAIFNQLELEQRYRVELYYGDEIIQVKRIIERR